MSVPGYSITVHSSLTTPILLAGAPRTLTIFNGTALAAVVFGMHSLIAILLAVPICVMIHIVAMLLAKRDPYFFQVILRHIRKKPYYRV